MIKRTLVSAFAIALLSTHAYLQEKGGEEEFGPYELVPNWPQPFAQTGYIMGSIPAVAVDTPNRIFIAMRGELKLPEKLPANFNGTWASFGERALAAKAEMRNCIFIVDANGKFVEAWNQWDRLFEYTPAGFGGPHAIKINPLDPERHVWVVNELGQQVYKFTNDGRQLVLTLGEKGVAGDDERHFGRPQDVAWAPDGSILVADGITNARVVKFDKTGKFLKAWGTKGNGPGQLNGPHGIETDRRGRIYVADRGNSRIQVFDDNGTSVDIWPNIRFPDHIFIPDDQNVWVSDGTTGKFLKYDPAGKLLYSWGVAGTYPGAHWEFHGFSVDSQGNLFTADPWVGRAQKFRPRPGADVAKFPVSSTVKR